MSANFLQQFYQLYQGQHQGLDLEMEKLLSRIAPAPDDELVANVTKIEKHQHEFRAKLCLQHDQLQDALAELHRLANIPPHVKQHIRDSTRPCATNSTNVTVGSLLNEMSEVVKLYRYVVLELNQGCDACQQNDDHLIEKHVSQLMELANILQINVALRDELDDILSQLANIDTTAELFSQFQQLINLLVKNINNEKHVSKHFLGALTKALLDVKSIVADSTALTSTSSQQRKLWDNDLKSHVENIGNQLEITNDTGHTQSIIAGEIDHILTAIEHKEKFDQREFQALTNNFNSMEQRLKAVEEEAQGYKSKLKQQQILSMQDSLTKLPNRAALDERFADDFKRAQRQNTPLWVVIADLDLFKNINDNYGHAAGDKTLQTIASLISRSLRTSEFIARFGGEEFVILVPDISRVAITTMLNRVREKVKSIPFKFKGSNIQVTISIGATKVKQSDPGEYFSFERADQALYRAKQQGRDRVIVD